MSLEKLFQRTAVVDCSLFALKHWHEPKALNSELFVGIVEPGNGYAKPESLEISIPEFPDTKNSTIYNGLINEAFRGPAQPVSSIYLEFLFFSCIPN